MTSLEVTIDNDEEVVVAILKDQLADLEDEMHQALAWNTTAWDLNKKDWKRLRKALIRVINYNSAPQDQLEE